MQSELALSRPPQAPGISPSMRMPQPQMPAFAFNGIVRHLEPAPQTRYGSPPGPFRPTLPGAGIRPSNWKNRSNPSKDSFSTASSSSGMSSLGSSLQKPSVSPQPSHLPVFSNITPSVSPAFTAQGLPSRKNLRVKLPEENSALWSRSAHALGFLDWIHLEGLEVTSRLPHDDELPAPGLPSTLDIYLPGAGGWEDVLEGLMGARGHVADDGMYLLPPDLLTMRLADLQSSMGSPLSMAMFSSPSPSLAPMLSPLFQPSPIPRRSPSLHDSSTEPLIAAPPPSLTPTLNPHAKSFEFLPKLEPNPPTLNPAAPVFSPPTLNPAAHPFEFVPAAALAPKLEHAPSETSETSDGFVYPGPTDERSQSVATQAKQQANESNTSKFESADDVITNPSEEGHANKDNDDGSDASSSSEFYETADRSHLEHYASASYDATPSSPFNWMAASAPPAASTMNPAAKPFQYGRRSTFGQEDMPAGATNATPKHLPRLSQIWTSGGTQKSDRAYVDPAQNEQENAQRMRSFRFPSEPRSMHDDAVEGPDMSKVHPRAPRSEDLFATLGRNSVHPAGLSDHYSTRDSSQMFSPPQGGRLPLPDYSAHDPNLSFDGIDQKDKLRSPHHNAISSDGATSLHLTDIDDGSQLSNGRPSRIDWRSFERLLDIKLTEFKEDLNGFQELKADVDSLKREAFVDVLLSRLDEKVSVWGQRQDTRAFQMVLDRVQDLSSHMDQLGSLSADIKQELAEHLAHLAQIPRGPDASRISQAVSEALESGLDRKLAHRDGEAQTAAAVVESLSPVLAKLATSTEDVEQIRAILGGLEAQMGSQTRLMEQSTLSVPDPFDRQVLVQAIDRSRVYLNDRLGDEISELAKVILLQQEAIEKQSVTHSSRHQHTSAHLEEISDRIMASIAGLQGQVMEQRREREAASEVALETLRARLLATQTDNLGLQAQASKLEGQLAESEAIRKDQLSTFATQAGALGELKATVATLEADLSVAREARLGVASNAERLQRENESLRQELEVARVQQQDRVAWEAQKILLQSQLLEKDQRIEALVKEGEQRQHMAQQLEKSQAAETKLRNDMNEMEHDLVELKVAVAKELQDAATKTEVAHERLRTQTEENQVLQRIVSKLYFTLDEADFPGMYSDLTLADSTDSMPELSKSQSTATSRVSMDDDGWWEAEDPKC